MFQNLKSVLSSKIRIIEQYNLYWKAILIKSYLLKYIEENGFKVKSSEIKESYQKFQKASSYYISQKKTSHINLQDSTPLDHDSRGKFFIREIINKESKLRLANYDEVKKCNVLAAGGIDFDTPRHLAALLKFASNLEKLCTKKTEWGLQDGLALSIMPEVGRKERYEAAIKYSYDTEHYPDYIEARVREFLLPKILEIQTENILTKKTLFSFSVGGREIMMMENALTNILEKEHSLSNEEIAMVYSTVEALCVGYAFDPRHIKEIGFKKTIIFSVHDRGVLLPPPLTLYMADALITKPESFKAYKLNNSNQAITNLIIISNKNIPRAEPDDNDHSIGHYQKCISSLPEAEKEFIGAMFCAEQVDL